MPIRIVRTPRDRLNIISARLNKIKNKPPAMDDPFTTFGEKMVELADIHIELIDFILRDLE